jgi:ribosomal protein S18 acetylase RimI-like enzyme
MIREATLNDAPAIASVHVATWQHAYRGIIPDEVLDGLSVADRTQRWLTIMSDIDSSTATFVESDGSAVRGFVSVGPNRDEDDELNDAWEIYALYVDVTLHRSGIGQALLRAAVDVVPSGVRLVTLWVLADNVGARRFYETQGFVEDGATLSRLFGDKLLVETRYALKRSRD